MIISVYHQKVYIEYRLPNIENIDYSIYLAKELFMLTKDKRLDFENENGTWYLKNCKGLNVSDQDIRNGRVMLSDSCIFTVSIGGGKLRIICCNESENYAEYKKYIISSCSRFTIGKDEQNDLCYNYQDLISRQHAMFQKQSNGWCVIDNSTNGVFVNNIRVQTQQALRFGDTVNIFGLNVIFLGDVIAVGSRCVGFVCTSTLLGEYTDVAAVAEIQESEEKVFNRSPRIIDHIYEETIEIESPPQMQAAKKASLLSTIGPSFTMAIPMMLGCMLAIYNSRSHGATSSAFMYTGIITALGSALIGSFWAFRNMKEARKNELEHENKRFKTYSEYLTKTADEIQSKYKNNYDVLNKIYPSPEKVCSYNSNSIELWSRNYHHKDFLYHRLGLGEIPFQCELSAPKEKFSMNYDSLQSKPTKIGNQYKMIYNVPVGIDLMAENLYGIIGSVGKKGAISIMHALAVQIAANNCYTDVKLVFIYNTKKPSDKENWDFFRWLPHVYSENRKVRFVASDQYEAADVFFELANVIRKRLDDQQDNNQKSIVKPHYVVFIEDYSILDGEPIARYLLQQHNTYGVTTFILSDYYYNLPNACENIIENDEYGNYIYNAVDTENEKKQIVFDTISVSAIKQFVKRIADLRVAEAESDSEIPNNLSFLDMYGVSKLEELNVAERWRKNRTYNTMKALIGKKAGGVDCYLDIHEKYHGPHGLVAGTTGSGKSETLQTYILSLAINFSPEDVSFLIIDFKGGGMSNLFDGLPHMAGTISNLSGNQINRAMVSIKSEIRRRQVIFSENGVNNINAYTNIYKSKEAKLPVPHLLIIIDEFAEMKREEPEFMKELISVAQVGRSLGIHLILATQKPSGTVDDNIWSNTKFRLCLRVQSRSDSMDMLHTPDAAYLSQAGRCYLQVGSDEIFELFQSGWSGAIFDSSDSSSSTNAVTMISLTGKAAIIGNRAKLKRSKANKKKWLTALCTEYFKSLPKYDIPISSMDTFMLDEFVTRIIKRLRAKEFRYSFSEQEKNALIDFYKRYEEDYSADLIDENVDDIIAKGIKYPDIKEESQLDAVVDHLRSVAARSGISNNLILWLPPLKKLLYLSDLEGYEETSFEKAHWNNAGGHFTLEVSVGLCDDPENQMQSPLTLDFAKTGHHAVIGAVVSGKSTFMQTMLYALCDKYSPDRLNMYILDFSSGSLSPFAEAPHCGGVLNEKDIDQVPRLLNLISKMIHERKNLFNGGSYTQYVKAYGIKLPVIVVAVDNYAGFSEKTEGKYEQFFSRLAREGASYGIFLLLSAQGFGISEIPNRLADNIGTVVTVNLGDKFKYMDALRTTSMMLIPETGVKGRGLAYSGDRLLEYQTAIAIEAEDDYARLEIMKKKFVAMHESWDGVCARKIPTIPAEPVLSDLKTDPDYNALVTSKQYIPFAYNIVDASVFSVDLAETYCYCISGKQRTGKTSVLRIMLEAVSHKNGTAVVFEKRTREFAQLSSDPDTVYLDSDKKLFDFFSEMLSVFRERNALKHQLQNDGLNDKEIFERISSEKPYYIFINDMTDFLKSVYTPEDPSLSMNGFLENIIEKGALHNIYFFACVDVEKTFEISGYKAYTEFIKYKKGVHLGGYVSQQQIFTFQNIPFNETSRSYKKGIGLTPDSEDDSQGVKIIIPALRR